VFSINNENETTTTSSATPIQPSAKQYKACQSALSKSSRNDTLDECIKKQLGHLKCDMQAATTEVNSIRSAPGKKKKNNKQCLIQWRFHIDLRHVYFVLSFNFVFFYFRCFFASSHFLVICCYCRCLVAHAYLSSLLLCQNILDYAILKYGSFRLWCVVL